MRTSGGTSEHNIQNDIRVVLSSRGHKVFRVNVVTGWQGQPRWLEDGTVLLANPRMVTSGVPKGFSDLLCVRKGDGVACFIECKAANGTPTQEQLNFLEQMMRQGCRVGIARSVEDALKIVEGEDNV